MAKRAILIHGWGGNPKNCWFPWLKEKLEEKGFEVVIPAMPNSDNPELEPWLTKVKETVGMPDEDTYFFGHSLACITIVRYLLSLPEDKKVGGCVFVAGFNFLDPEIKDFYKRELDIDKLKEKCKSFVNLYSDNDPYVPVESSEEFADLIEAKKVFLPGRGHFSDDAGVKELPEALEELLKMSS